MGQQASPVAICSNALSQLGEAAITSLTDGTVRSNQCNSHFGPARDQALERMRPNFAKTVVVLAQASPAPSIKWDAEFPLPSDYITMVEVLPAGAGQAFTPVDYEIIGQSLFTDQATIEIIYIKRVTDSTLWTPSFALALMYKLAALIAPLLKSDKTWAESMELQFERTLEIASVIDAQEESTKPIQADDLIVVRSLGVTVRATT